MIDDLLGDVFGGLIEGAVEVAGGVVEGVVEVAGGVAEGAIDLVADGADAMLGGGRKEEQKAAQQAVSPLVDAGR